MSTLAFGQMLYFLFVSLSVLGGDDGHTLSNRSSIFGEPCLTSDFSFYYLCLAVLFLAYLLLTRIAGSRFGRVLNACRGIPCVRGAWLSAFRVPAGRLRDRRGDRGDRRGAACQPERICRTGLHVLAAFGGEFLVMTILGGVGSLWGAVLGATWASPCSKRRFHL